MEPKEEISDEELVKGELKPIIMETFLNRQANYRTDAVYQRGNKCWTIKMQQTFIKSIFANLPVGCFHLVKHKNSAQYNVLDGKQRLEAILDFIAGKFKVEWQDKVYDYKSLCKSDDLYGQFYNFTLHVIYWPSMSILKQRDLFLRVNSNSPLKPNEILYADNFFTKNLLTYAWNNCFNKIKKHLRQEISGDRRSAGIRWTHDTLYSCFGDIFSGAFDRRIVSTKKVQESAKLVNDMILPQIADLYGDDEDFITEDLLSKLPCYENLLLIKRLAEAFAQVLDFKNTLSKKCNKNDITDIVSFLIGKIKSKVLTTSQIIEHKAEFYSFVCSYMEQKSIRNLTTHQTSIAVMNGKYDLLEELYNLLKIDHTQKCQAIPDRDKTLALLRDSECNLCGTVLNDNNYNQDHVNPKSLAGQTENVLLCDSCNRKKSNLSKEMAEKIARLRNF